MKFEWLPTPKTNKSPLKMDGWNTSFLVGWPIGRGSFRESNWPMVPLVIEDRVVPNHPFQVGRRFPWLKAMGRLITTYKSWEGY